LLDYTQANALERMVFQKLNLPKWLDIKTIDAPVTRIDTYDISVSRVRGSDVPSLRGCSRLPANRNVDYLLVRYARELNFTLAGESVVISSKNAQDMCLLLDICSSGGCGSKGGFAFLLGLPSSVLNSFKTIPAYGKLAAQGLTIDSLRLGVGGLLEAFPDGAPVFWNGYKDFKYSGSTQYNFYLGGTVVMSTGSDLSVTLNGDLFFALPGICGDFRDLLGTGKWGMAARGQVRIVYNFGFGSGLFALRSAFVLSGDATMLLSLGGQDQPVCGTATDPSGLFIKVNVKAGVSVTEATILNLLLAIVSPSAAISVDAYLMVRQDTRLLPPYILDEFVEGVQLTVSLVLNFVSWLKDIGTKTTGQVISDISSIGKNMQSFISNCAGTPSCWMSSPELSGASTAFRSLVGTVQSLSSTVSQLFARVDAIIQSAQAIVKQLQDNVQLAVNVSRPVLCNHHVATARVMMWMAISLIIG
jgi:hypothetical protein